MLRPGFATYSLAACTIAVVCARVASAETSISLNDSMPVFNGRPSFTSLRLHSVQKVNHNTKRLRFAFADENASSGLPLTSSLLTFMRPSNTWLPVLRPYTPISDLSEPGFIDLLVKKYPGGKASSHLHSLKPGEALTFVVSLNGYAWTPNRHSHIYLLAGGAGITPMYQLIQGVLKNPADRTKVTLVFGVNSKEDMVLREELDAFESQYPDRLNVLYTISSNNTATEEGSRHFEQGRITESLLRSVMKSDEEGVKVFVSGPPAMEAALMGSNGWSNSGAGGILGKLGYTKNQIYKF